MDDIIIKFKHLNVEEFVLLVEVIFFLNYRRYQKKNGLMFLFMKKISSNLISEEYLNALKIN